MIENAPRADAWIAGAPRFATARVLAQPHRVPGRARLRNGTSAQNEAAVRFDFPGMAYYIHGRTMIPRNSETECEAKMSNADDPKHLVVFQNKSIRRIMVDDEWFFSVIDVIAVLTDSANPRDYWFKMKKRVHSEDGFELSTICRQLKLPAPDGKMRTTDCANVRKNAPGLCQVGGVVF